MASQLVFFGELHDSEGPTRMTCKKFEGTLEQITILTLHIISSDTMF